MSVCVCVCVSTFESFVWIKSFSLLPVWLDPAFFHVIISLPVNFRTETLLIPLPSSCPEDSGLEGP